MNSAYGISTRLDTIARLFPAERLALSRARWTRLWEGQAPLGRLPFMLAPARHDYYSADRTPAEVLDRQLDEIILHGEAKDDFIPSLFPGCHVGAIPSMFGAREVIAGDDLSCERLLSSLAGAVDLPCATIPAGSVAQRWLDMQADLREATGGRLPIHVTDMQGPFDVAAKLLGYDDLFIGAYEDRAAYDALVDRAAQAFIAYWNAQARPLGELFVGTHLWGWSWVPPGNGATVSVDSLVMFSPEFFTEAVRPHLETISGALGGIVVHSCGNFAHVVPALCRTQGLKGVNASQMSLADLAHAGLPPDKVACLNVALDRMEETAALIASRRQRAEITVGGIWPDGDPQAWRDPEWRAIRERVTHVDQLMTRAAQAWEA